MSRVSSQRPLLSLLCIFAKESAEDGWASGRKEKREEKFSTTFVQSSPVGTGRWSLEKEGGDRGLCSVMLVTRWKGGVKDRGTPSARVWATVSPETQLLVSEGCPPFRYKQVSSL